MPKLLDDEEDENTFEIKVNEKYADHYAVRKRKEELATLKKKEKMGYLDSEEEESSETEDEDGELLTNEVELKILDTIRKIRSKDPSIYDETKVFFTEEELAAQAEAKKALEGPKPKDKKLTLRDLERQTIIETQGKMYDSDEEERKIKANAVPLSHVEQQRQLKKAFLQTADKALESEEEDGFLRKRDKTREEEEREEKDFVEWIKDKEGVKDEDEILQRYFQDETKLDESERFLRDYVLHQGWVDKDMKRKGKIPSYNEIVGGSEISDGEDMEAVEKADAFEHKYNFRFEEQGSEMIVSHARNIDGSVRKQDDKRKRMRERKLERKEEEKKKKEEELKRLKNLKKKEIMEKLKTIREMAGGDAPEDALEGIDLLGDFDPDEYDKKMNSIFNEDYYQKHDDGIGADDEGVLAADDKRVSAWEGEEKLDDNVEYDYEDDGDYDENYDYEAEEEEEEAEEAPAAPVQKGKNNKNNTAGPKKFKDIDRKSLQAQGLEKYLDELYKLDYEDLIAGEIPCRFKYTSVPKNDYNLSVTDILEIPDKKLNKYVGLRKLAPYRDDYETKSEKGRSKLERKYWAWRKDVEEELPALKIRRLAREKREKKQAMRGGAAPAPVVKKNLWEEKKEKKGKEFVQAATKVEEAPKEEKKKEKKEKKEKKDKEEEGEKKHKRKHGEEAEEEEAAAPAEEGEGGEKKKKKSKKNDRLAPADKMTEFGIKQSRLDTYTQKTGGKGKHKK